MFRRSAGYLAAHMGEAIPLLVALILGALAVSGKLSITGSDFLLALAWLVGIVAVREQSLAHVAIFAAVWGFALFLLAWWTQPSAVPSNVGELKPATKLVFSANGPYPKLEVGDSGVFFQKIDKYGTIIFPFLERDQFRVEIIDGQYKFSTDVTDENGKIIAQIIQNQWKVVPPPGTWDRNYDSNAIEVKDAFGDIVLQVRALADRIQFQGIWWTDKSMWPGFNRVEIAVDRSVGNTPFGIEIVTAVMLGRVKKNEKPNSIKPLFLYPSEYHLGELAK